MYVVKIPSCAKRMKYVWTSMVDVYYKAAFRLPRVNLFTGMSKSGKKKPKINTFSYKSPLQTTKSGPLLQLTSEGLGRGWKEIGREASNFCVPHCLCLRLWNWSSSILSSEVKWLQTAQTDATKAGVCVGINLNYDGGLDGSVPSVQKFQQKLPLSSVQHSVPPRVGRSNGSRTKHLHELSPIIKNTVFPLTTEGNDSDIQQPFLPLVSGWMSSNWNAVIPGTAHFYTFWEIFQ